MPLTLTAPLSLKAPLAPKALRQSSRLRAKATRTGLRVQAMAGEDEASRVVVLGGGIVGCSIAYQLAKKGQNVTVLERCKIAASAGGKGGGFLAGGWGGNGVTAELHEKSFALHETLAKELSVESYRKITTLQVRPASKGKNVASWLDGDASSAVMDPDTAQVNPFELTTKMMAGAEKLGANVVIGTAAGLELDGDKLTGIKLENGETISCSQAVVAMGVWSTLLEDWGLGLNVPMEGVKSTSLVYQNMPQANEEPYALFCGEDYRFGTHLEVYPRNSGEIYICGCGGSDYVSGSRLRKGGDCEMPEQIEADPARVEAASKAFASITSAGAKGPDVVQACMRPCPPDALPIMGEVPGADGLYIAAGHNCWGILWAPITGLAMAELMVDGKSSVNLAPFTPLRYQARAKGGRGRKNAGTSVGEQW